jgi:hypothetical protein
MLCLLWSFCRRVCLCMLGTKELYTDKDTKHYLPV